MVATGTRSRLGDRVLGSDERRPSSTVTRRHTALFKEHGMSGTDFYARHLMQAAPIAFSIEVFVLVNAYRTKTEPPRKRNMCCMETCSRLYLYSAGTRHGVADTYRPSGTPKFLVNGEKSMMVDEEINGEFKARRQSVYEMLEPTRELTDLYGISRSCQFLSQLEP